MKELIIIISSTWKFAATFPVAIYLLRMSVYDTILYTNIGGLIGIIIFTFLTKIILKIAAYLSIKIKIRRRKTKKIFSPRNRRLISLKNKFGLHGIVILTPVLLSIPVGVFLITKYFGRKKLPYFYLFASQIVWSLIYTIFYTSVQTAF